MRLHFLQVLTAFGSMFLNTNELSDRLSIILTMFLTAVAFQFVVSSQLPEKAYLTIVDKYIISSFVLLFMQALFACSATGFVDDDHPAEPFLMEHSNT
eukprot:COSAG01_NODE_35013_length_538_cov_1.514806_1_plen_97_part_10